MPHALAVSLLDSRADDLALANGTWSMEMRIFSGAHEFDGIRVAPLRYKHGNVFAMPWGAAAATMTRFQTELWSQSDLVEDAVLMEDAVLLP